MTRVARRFTGVALAIAATAGIGALSWAPYTADPHDHAVIKLSWRARGERARVCHHLTEEELGALPPHMREAEDCSVRGLPYRLRVALDGVPVVDDIVQAGGARHDRPLYVSQAVPATPGQHTVRLVFGLEEANQESTVHDIELDTTLVLATRRIALITYDEQRRRFVVLPAASESR